MRILSTAALHLALCLAITPLMAAETPPLLEDEDLRQNVQSLSRESDHADRLRRARDLTARHRLSSLQVKAICAKLHDDESRLDFALSAFARVVDPENFYEVYDAFTSFSKVLRLHDQVRPQQPRPVPPATYPPPVVSDTDFEQMLSALRRESFDNTRTQLARQMLSSGGPRFLSRQVKQMVGCFSFEPAKLEIAKFAYDYTFDRENYFLVGDAFEFSHSRDTLSRYIQSKQQPPGGNR